MPSALTSRQIDDLKQLLQVRERQLQATLEAELHVEDPTHASITASSDADWITDDVAADALINNAERHSAALDDTHLALDKVADGTYGACERCSAPVGYARLLAYPSARRCMTCQTHYEKQIKPNAQP